MDRRVVEPRYRRWLLAGLGVVLAALLFLVVWAALPRGLAVRVADLQVARVTSGQFKDEILMRATVTPLVSVMLDSTEGGRVEAVMARDGAMVKQGELLFRLSNPQREQELLARASDVAQQVANTATLRVASQSSHSEHKRRIAGLEYELDRVRKKHTQNERLAEQGFLSAAALEESLDLTRQQERLLVQAREDAVIEQSSRDRAIAEMDRAVGGLNRGLALVRAATEALAVRAPADGRLTGFNLDVGTSVKAGDRLGRIDSPRQFKLVAQADEYYLGRISAGLKGAASVGESALALQLTRLNPQVKDRRFEVELEFSQGAPEGLQAGQTVDMRLALGQPGPALLIPEGPFFADTGGTWVFVLTPDGKGAERRQVRLGRRSVGQIEVLSGVAESEQVVISSYGAFANAQRLRLEE